MICLHCHTERETKTDRVPRGWHRVDEGVVCKACWQARYVLRAVTIPIVGPVDGTWVELRTALREAWGAATGLSNWMLTQLYARDVRREPGVEKLPPMPPIYLYPEARAAFPDMSAQTVAAMEQAIKGKYRATRYKLLWTNEVSLPNYRYPAPLVVPNQAWRVCRGEQGEPLVSLPMGGRRWTLRLRGGGNFRRQLAAVDQIISCEAVQGELALYRKRASSGDHRNGTTGRDSGGQHASHRVMCKMVAWFPRDPARADLAGTFFVRTDSDSLLVALNAKDERLWVYNGDQLRQWAAEHRRRLNRWADDAKAGDRPPAFGSKREAAARKFRHRLDTATHQIAAELVAYARRRRFAAIRYDDSDQRFCDRFPYFRLAALVAEKADAAGIPFERSGDAKKAATSRGDKKED